MPLKDYRFSDKHYAKMLINVHQIGDNSDLYKKFESVLSSYELFKPWYVEDKDGTPAERQEKYRTANMAKFGHPNVSNNMVIRFIAYFYDPGCPFNVIADYKERKNVCAEKAGFKIDSSGLFEEPFQHILNGKNKTVNMMAIYYLRFFRNTTYTTLRVTLEKFYNNVLMDNNIAEIQKSSNFIDAQTKAFLHGEKEMEELYLNPVLYGIIDTELAEIERLRPERVLEKIMSWG